MSDSVFVVNSTFATDAIDANASPRNPSVPIAPRSSGVRIFDVACLSNARNGVVAGHAFAVVAYTHKRRPPSSMSTVSAPRARVDRILNKLFDHGRRTLDHLARGDLIRQGVGSIFILFILEIDYPMILVIKVNCLVDPVNKIQTKLSQE